MDLDKVFYVRNKQLKDVIDDGVKAMVNNDADGFEYVVGEIQGCKVKVSLESNKEFSHIVEIDGVTGFGYILLGESK